MHRERIADDVYVFVSDIYAQVTATVIATPDGAVVFDTMLAPDETQGIRRFIDTRLNMPVRYVINSHYHADHSAGTHQFAGAQVVSTALCRELLDRKGRESLERSKANAPELRNVEIVLPDVTFSDSRMQITCGGRTLELWTSPGHSRDSLVCLLADEHILLAADTVMPLPYFVDGDYDALVASLKALAGSSFETVVQGHGDVILRGEIEDRIAQDLHYLAVLRAAVDDALGQVAPERALQSIDIESCGKSRILLNGLVEQLHRQNVTSLAAQRRQIIRM